MVKPSSWAVLVIWPLCFSRQLSIAHFFILSRLKLLFCSSFESLCELLNWKSIKLRSDEVEGLKEWEDNLHLLTEELGKLRLQKFLIDREELLHKAKLEDLLNKEWKITSSYKEKHPNGFFDLEKGEFIYSE